MRLINAKTHRLEEIRDVHVPPYAILSHRWEDEEILTEDIHSGTASQKRGYAKLSACCEEAQRHNLDYVWIDTCSINRANSSEVTQSMNSMFKWYSKAAVCFAYLADVGSENSSFEKSEWFNRGWTLQELIAPSNLRFYNSNWDFIGTKSDLESTISEITGIDPAVLAGASPESCSVAQRMSWAAKRATTLVEDRAYSLIGMFDVNLPIIYGEGEKAFIRLQEEIIKHSDDHSIFAWSSNFPGERCGLLAPSLSCFERCRDVVRCKPIYPSEAFSVTNRGLSIVLPSVPWAMNTFLSILDCRLKESPEHVIGILLERLSADGQYARTQVDGMKIQNIHQKTLNDLSPTRRHAFIRQSIIDPPIRQKYAFWLRTLEIPLVNGNASRPIDIWSRDRTAQLEDSHMLQIPTGCSGSAGIVKVSCEDMVCPLDNVHFLKFGFDRDFKPVCLARNGHAIGRPGTHVSNMNAEDLLIPSPAKSRNHIEPLYQDHWTDDGLDKVAHIKDNYWLLKGTESGLRERIPTLNITVQIQLVVCPGQQDLAEDLRQDIWAIDILDSPPPLDRRVTANKPANSRTVSKTSINKKDPNNDGGDQTARPSISRKDSTKFSWHLHPRTLIASFRSGKPQKANPKDEDKQPSEATETSSSSVREPEKEPGDAQSTSVQREQSKSPPTTSHQE